MPKNKPKSKQERDQQMLLSSMKSIAKSLREINARQEKYDQLLLIGLVHLLDGAFGKYEKPSMEFINEAIQTLRHDTQQ